MKFKIGDTVEVIGVNNPENIPLSRSFKKGHRGKMTGYDSDCPEMPYIVQRKNGVENNFNARELKLIRKGG